MSSSRSLPLISFGRDFIQCVFSSASKFLFLPKSLDLPLIPKNKLLPFTQEDELAADSSPDQRLLGRVFNFSIFNLFN